MRMILMKKSNKKQLKRLKSIINGKIIAMEHFKKHKT